MLEIIAAGSIGVALFVAFVMIPMMWRVVVPTNEVHIVQTKKTTVSYGKDHDGGNTYYHWPSWIPVVGVTRIMLPVSVFDVELKAYEAFDKGRVPFVIDVKAFFRIDKSNDAAQRVSSFDELKEQLEAILQSAARTILATSDIEEIMEGRGRFGDAFTKEVAEDLRQWGVIPVKNIELMDIRDAQGSKVIANIMEKKKSLIEMESRTEVARNRQRAETAEIEAAREVELRKQEAAQQVGQRQAETSKNVGIAQEKANQDIKEQQILTTQRDVEVRRANEIGQAEINKNVAIVTAEQNKETALINAEAQRQRDVILAEGQKKQAIINAEATKESTVLKADGDLAAAKNEAEGTRAIGIARAEAEKAMQMAPVDAQITLAKEIGENEGYQTYLINAKQVDANKEVGVEQAKALANADIKIIANTGGDIQGGFNGVTSLLTPKGGTSLAGMMEGVAQSEAGKALLKRFGINLDDVNLG